MMMRFFSCRLPMVMGSNKVAMSCPCGCRECRRAGMWTGLLLTNLAACDRERPAMVASLRLKKLHWPTLVAEIRPAFCKLARCAETVDCDRFRRRSIRPAHTPRCSGWSCSWKYCSGSFSHCKICRRTGIGQRLVDGVDIHVVSPELTIRFLAMYISCFSNSNIVILRYKWKACWRPAFLTAQAGRGCAAARPDLSARCAPGPPGAWAPALAVALLICVRAVWMEIRWRSAYSCKE